MRTLSILIPTLTLSAATLLCGQTKYTGELRCNKADPVHSIEIGDRPGHSFRIGKAQCTWVKPFEIDGVKSVSEEATHFAEITGDKARVQGRNIGAMANGSKYFVRYQSTSVYKDGVLQSSDVKWTWTGTGKLKGVSAKGTSSGKANPDGTSTWLVDGEYTVGK
jgi:hypothetical protein